MSKNILSIVKIGGNIVDNPKALASFLNDFNSLQGQKILVHGGGVMASKMATQLNIETTMIDGRRVTDFDTLKLVSMVYAGWINKNIVAQLQKDGCNAVGLSGVDANCIPSNKRSPQPIDYGFVGDPITTEMNVDFISTLLMANAIPVFCAITHDKKGSLLNTNADTIAYSLAAAMSAIFDVTLYYCFEKDGVLRDVENPQSIIESINSKEYAKLKLQGVIAGGMIPKLDNSFKAISQGVSQVLILHARNLLNMRGTRLTMNNKIL